VTRPKSVPVLSSQSNVRAGEWPAEAEYSEIPHHTFDSNNRTSMEQFNVVQCSQYYPALSQHDDIDGISGDTASDFNVKLGRTKYVTTHLSCL